MNTMKYKGYVARIEYDEADRIFVGHLAGIIDIVDFHGSTVDQLEQAFHESVGDYIVISEETDRRKNLIRGNLCSGFPRKFTRQLQQLLRHMVRV